MEDGSHPFRVYCNASIEGFGATLEQEQPDGSVRPIAYVSRATLDSERHWTPLELEADSIVWVIKRLRGYLWGTKFRIFSHPKALEKIEKFGDHNARVQKWLEHLTAFDYTREAQMVMLSSSRGCHSRRLSTTAAVLAASPLSTMRSYASSGLAACSPPPHRSPALAWVGWCPDPIAPSWVGSPLPPLILAILAHTDHV